MLEIKRMLSDKEIIYVLLMTLENEIAKSLATTLDIENFINFVNRFDGYALVPEERVSEIDRKNIIVKSEIQFSLDALVAYSYKNNREMKWSEIIDLILKEKGDRAAKFPYQKLQDKLLAIENRLGSSYFRNIRRYTGMLDKDIKKGEL